MKKPILFLTLSFALLCQAQDPGSASLFDPKAASLFTEALRSCDKLTYEDALKAADLIKEQAPNFPGNPYFKALYEQIAAVFAAKRNLEAAQADLAQKKDQMKRQLTTMGQSRRILFEGNKKIEDTRKELSAALQKAGPFNRGFFDQGYDEPAQIFQAVLTRIAKQFEVAWAPPPLPRSRKHYPSLLSYANVIVEWVNKDGIHIKHKTGRCDIPIEQLPQEIRTELGMSLDGVAEYRQQVAEKRRKDEEQQKAWAEQQNVMAEQQRAIAEQQQKAMAGRRIGETFQQCQQRYGAPIKVDGSVAVFDMSGFRIIITFFQGKADCILYGKVEQDILGKAVEMSDNEVQKLLDINAGQSTWKKRLIISVDREWETEDGEVLAYYSTFENFLSVFSKGYAERHSAAERAKENKALERF